MSLVAEQLAGVLKTYQDKIKHDLDYISRNRVRETYDNGVRSGPDGNLPRDKEVRRVGILTALDPKLILDVDHLESFIVDIDGYLTTKKKSYDHLKPSFYGTYFSSKISDFVIKDESLFDQDFSIATDRSVSQERLLQAVSEKGREVLNDHQQELICGVLSDRSLNAEELPNDTRIESRFFYSLDLSK